MRKKTSSELKEELKEQYPDNTTASNWVLTGQQHASTDNDDTAVACYLIAINDCGRDDFAQGNAALNLGNHYGKFQDFEIALYYYNKADELKDSPLNITPYHFYVLKCLYPKANTQQKWLEIAEGYKTGKNFLPKNDFAARVCEQIAQYTTDENSSNGNSTSNESKASKLWHGEIYSKEQAESALDYYMTWLLSDSRDDQEAIFNAIREVLLVLYPDTKTPDQWLGLVQKLDQKKDETYKLMYESFCNVFALDLQNEVEAQRNQEVERQSLEEQKQREEQRKQAEEKQQQEEQLHKQQEERKSLDEARLKLEEDQRTLAEDRRRLEEQRKQDMLKSKADEQPVEPKESPEKKLFSLFRTPTDKKKSQQDLKKTPEKDKESSDQSSLLRPNEKSTLAKIAQGVSSILAGK